MTSDIETIDLATTGFSDADALPQSDPTATKAAYQQILARHLLVSLRHECELTMDAVARRKGVTKGAIQQLETRELSKIQIGSLITYIQALGFDVDEDWLTKTLVAALPRPAEYVNS